MTQEAGWRYALRLLTYRARSVRELRERLLERGLSKTASEQVVRRLKGVGLVNDRELAESVVRWAMDDSKPHSRREVEEKLRGLGIEPDLIEEALKPWTDAVENQMAVRYVRRRLGPGGRASEADRGRAFRSAVQKGFAFPTVREAFRVLESEIPETG